MTFQLKHLLLIHVVRHLVVLTVNVRLMLTKQYVHVYPYMPDHHLDVDLNVLLVQNVHRTKLVLIRNVLTHVQEHAAKMHVAKLLITVLYVLAK